MVRFVLRSGRKSDGDTMVFVDARDEVLRFQELLFILKHYFESEQDYYPVSQGFVGKAMLQAAIVYVANGVSVEKVCRVFRLPFKPLDVVDQRTRVRRVTPLIVSEKSNLAELM